MFVVVEYENSRKENVACFRSVHPSFLEAKDAAKQYCSEYIQKNCEVEKKPELADFDSEPEDERQEAFKESLAEWKMENPHPRFTKKFISAQLYFKDAKGAYTIGEQYDDSVVFAIVPLPSFENKQTASA